MNKFIRPTDLDKQVIDPEYDPNQLEECLDGVSWTNVTPAQTTIIDDKKIKKTGKQDKPNHRELTEAGRYQWSEESSQLNADIAKIGYQDLSKDKFLEIIIDNSMDISTQSQLIDLQKKCKELIERKAVLWAEDHTIDELNKKHYIVHIDQTYILTEKNDVFGNKNFSLEKSPSFTAYYFDELVTCADGKKRNKATIWLASPKKRKFQGITFDPTTTEHSNDYYNIWNGFTRKEKEGDCSKYWDHVENNICNGDQELYGYVRKWLACVFQYPDRVHTALVLQGSQGTGKNRFVEPLGILLGQHYAPLSSIHELVSHFNSHMKTAVLIHANESLWGGDKRDIGRVKAMITEETCLIEAKGKDGIIVRNFKHVIFSSNEQWPVHMDPDCRRFLVISVGEGRKENHDYFKAMIKQLNNGGYEALLYDLMHEDLRDFNPRIMPKTTGSFNVKMLSADSAHRYIYQALREGGFSISCNPIKGRPAWQPTIPKSNVYKDYVEWCAAGGEKALSQECFGKTIKKTVKSINDTRPIHDGMRVNSYELPSPRQAREDFCKAFNETHDRIFGDCE